MKCVPTLKICGICMGIGGTYLGIGGTYLGIGGTYLGVGGTYLVLGGTCIGKGGICMGMGGTLHADAFVSFPTGKCRKKSKDESTSRSFGNFFLPKMGLLPFLFILFKSVGKKKK